MGARVLLPLIFCGTVTAAACSSTPPHLDDDGDAGAALQDPGHPTPTPSTTTTNPGTPVLPPVIDTTGDDGSGALEACPGKSISVQPNQDIKLEGDTTKGKSDRAGKDGACAAGSGASDFVYHLVPTGSGSLQVSLTPTDTTSKLDPITYLRSSCDDTESQVSCGAESATKTASFRVNIVKGKDYFLFIDGANKSVGPYTADVLLTPQSFCGDGVVDSGEACDDTNHADGDGCAASCRGVDGNPASAGSCPGQPVDMWKGNTVTGKGTTTGQANSLSTPSNSCDLTGTNDSIDHVYQVTPHADGNLTVSLTSTASLNITVHGTCTANAAATQCSPAGTPLTVPVTNGTPVFIAVDAATEGVTGDFTISFKL